MRVALVLGISVLALLILFPARPLHAVGVSTSSLAGFSLSTNPSTLSIEVGAAAASTVTVSSEGIDGPVNLNVEVSSSSGLTASLNPTDVVVLPGGTADSIMNIDGSSAHPGIYNVEVIGSSLLAPSASTTLIVNITGLAGNPPSSPPTGATPPAGSPPPSGSGSTSNSGSSNPQTTTSTSGRTPKGNSGSNGQNSSPSSDPVAFLIAGNLLAAITTAAALGTLHRRKRQASLSKWQ